MLIRILRRPVCLRAGSARSQPRWLRSGSGIRQHPGSLVGLPKVPASAGVECGAGRGRGRQNIFEQISSGGTTSYLHHDQQGSTRLLTGSAGTVTGKCTYTPYGTPTCEGTATTPLGFDGQYTSSDTGLIYLRARTYDPATAQFLTVDPRSTETGAPYAYAEDNPITLSDL